MVDLMVIPQPRPYQMERGQSANAYAASVNRPMVWKTSWECAPGGMIALAMCAAISVTTRMKTAHPRRLEPMFDGPFGITVIRTLGPRFTFAMNSGDLISAMLDGRGIM